MIERKSIKVRCSTRKGRNGMVRYCAYIKLEKSINADVKGGALWIHIMAGCGIDVREKDSWQHFVPNWQMGKYILRIASVPITTHTNSRRTQAPIQPFDMNSIVMIYCSPFLIQFTITHIFVYFTFRRGGRRGIEIGGVRLLFNNSHRKDSIQTSFAPCLWLVPFIHNTTQIPIWGSKECPCRYKINNLFTP